MKKVVFILLLIFLALLVSSYFIRVKTTKEVLIANSFQNIIHSIMQPKSWIKWDDATYKAWQTDSVHCNFSQDTLHHSLLINIPGRQVLVTQKDYLLYQLEEVKDNNHAALTFSLTPFIGNQKGSSGKNTLVVYEVTTRLLYKLLPFANSNSFENNTIIALQSYLENAYRFYGYKIELKQSPDSIFLTKTSVVNKKELFEKLPFIFEDLQNFALANNISGPFNRNISFNVFGSDSTSVYAGININKKITNEFIFQTKSLRSGQLMAVGYYEGSFIGRIDLYKAIDKFLAEHDFIKGGAAFEKYLSPLPVNDSSIIKIELYYPLLNTVITSAGHY